MNPAETADSKQDQQLSSAEAGKSLQNLQPRRNWKG
jgi:hypothetical protein